MSDKSPPRRVHPIVRPVPGVAGRTSEWRTQRPELHAEECTQCMNCVIHCPDDTIKVDPETGFLKPKQLSDNIHKNGDVIEAIMGSQYRKNLESINKVVQILNRQGKIVSEPEAREAIIQTLRAGVAPPLTRRGRAFTAVVRLDSKAAHKSMARAILDPDEMVKMAELAEHNAVTRRSLELAGSLGLITDDDFQELTSERY